MMIGHGSPVYAGIASGKILVLRKRNAEINRLSSDKEKELERYHAAQDKARCQLETLYEKAKAELGEEDAAIIDIQLMLVDDLDFVEAVEGMIGEGFDAAFAVKETGEEQAAAFAALEDEYMNARQTDIRDVAARLIKILLDANAEIELTEPVILVADDLTPSETVQLDKSRILAFVTRQGSQNSHTAILARIMNIPSLVQADIEIDAALDGREMIVDGYTGIFYVDPDDEIRREMEGKKEKELKEKAELEKLRGVSSITRSGRKINLFANIGSVDDVKYVIAGDAEGVGLLRSEFLYLGRSDYPSEEELYESYKKIIEGLGGRRIVIRTLDIGADKKVDYFDLADEENPALGLRGIRICLTDKKLFRTQMRAIYRASAHGPVSIMFPMIISLKEVREIKEFCAAIRAELDGEHIAYGADVELGIMIETPAAALISETLAREVDFFSVGTNDLTQYTLALDRQNAALSPFFDPHHPAVMELLRLVAENAGKAGIWAGICGELAADLTLTDTFIKMGYTELSVSPSRILKLRRNVIESEE